MPLALWPLVQSRPVIQVILSEPENDAAHSLRLLADTGGGTDRSPFELILSEDDCRSCGVYTYHSVRLAGAYVGWFPLFAVRVTMPTIEFDGFVRAAGVPTSTSGLDGIACFRVLNRFTYGNFGHADQFGLQL